MNTEHIFDVLDISYREDSYSSIISNAFNNVSCFRNNIVNQFNLQNSDDWKSKLKLNINFRLNNRTRLIPDLILFSKKENVLIVIEVKIFSSEGKDQTEYYSSAKENISSALNLNNPTIRYIYLTLNGENAKSQEFENESFKKILISIPDDTDEIKYPYSILLTELKSRLKNYYDLKLEDLNLNALSFFTSTKQLINNYRLFEVAMSELIENTDFLKVTTTTNNPGDGLTYLIYWYKESWNGKFIREAKSGFETYEVHFEFHWHTQNDSNKFCLYLHYHPNPYHSQRQLNSLIQKGVIDSNFLKEYNSRRNEFYDYLYKNINSNFWVFDKTSLRISYTKINESVSLMKLKNILSEATKEMIPLIDKYYYV